MLKTTDLYISQLLTNVSIAYRNDEYIGEKVFPIVNVIKDTAKIASYGMDNLRIPEAYHRAPGSQTMEVDHTISTADHYTLKEVALKEIVPDEFMEQAERPFNAKVDAVENLTDRLSVIKEKAIADYITSTSNLSRNTTLTGTDQWDDFENSDPITDVRTGKESVRTYAGKMANTIILAHDVFIYLVDHPDVVDRVKYAKVAGFGELAQAMARVFDINNVLVGNSQYNSGKEGGTDTLADIWSKDVVIAYIDQRPTLKSRSLGFTYQSKAPRIVDEWYDEDRKGWYVRVTDKFDQKSIDVNCGYLIQAAVS